MSEKGNIKTLKAAKTKPAQLPASLTEPGWAADIAKDIAIHSGTGCFLLLLADGEEMDVYVSTQA